MNNRHLYKAKRLDNGEWIEGYYAFDCRCRRHMIFINEASCTAGSKPRRQEYYLTGYDIDPSTLCQCTRLEDRNGKLIWENDIVAFMDMYSTENGYAEMDCIGKVLWDDETLSFQTTGRLSAESYEVLEDCVVFGNIFDNPELLEERE